MSTFAGRAFFARGRPVELDKRLGKGGEGEVFSIRGDNALAAKLYAPHDAPKRQKKIWAMVRAGLADTTSTVAFPLHVIETDTSQFAGFLMRRVDLARPIHDLYAPGSRKRLFREADFRFIVRTALNAARAVAAAHAAGCVIGDINHSGFLVTQKAIVSLIDADSFQFMARGQPFLCEVGVPEYTPPELHGRSLAGIARTPDHDAFGLAVMLFQLLFMGRHPFAGVSRVGDKPIATAIAEHRFAYSRRRDTGLSPPPGAPSFDDVPATVAALFETAFDPKAGGGRPLPPLWVDALQVMERSLGPCPRNRRHHHASPRGQCPWCEMERLAGAPLFPEPTATGAASSNTAGGWVAFDDRAFAALLRELRPPQSFVYAPPSPIAKADRSRRRSMVRSRRAVAVLGIVGVLAVAVALIAAQPGLFMLWGFGAVAAVVALARAPSLEAAARSDLQDVDRRLDRAVRRIGEGLSLTALVALYDTLQDFGRRRAGLAKERSDVEATFRRERDDAIRMARLERFLIAHADLRGIGPSLVATLSSFGFDTAADIRRRDPTVTPGIGAVKAKTLRDWVDNLIQRIPAAPGLTAQERSELSQRIGAVDAMAASLDALIAREAARLRALLDALERARSARDAEVDGLLAERAAIVADLRSAGDRSPLDLSLPAIKLQAPRGAGTSSTASAPGTATSSGPNCPICGAVMIRRTARRGARRGARFWGCSRYPLCSGTRT